MLGKLLIILTVLPKYELTCKFFISTPSPLKIPDRDPSAEPRDSDSGELRGLKLEGPKGLSADPAELTLTSWAALLSGDLVFFPMLVFSAKLNL